jgi:hypothetical protein
MRLSYTIGQADYSGGTSFRTNDAMLMVTTTLGTSTSLWVSAGESWGDSLRTIHADVGVSWRF